ncbi:MAG: hypothetical protein A2770_01240 [Candidatus Levybacteria bacterium RIFCSPHIGHO2_01_FULL_38_12]|nr:MAG: hypothetical protein A2770_01240 [Candidatus Levybacteria bacterium RIFCSPHIGHO2_01_FULL_38_12]
MKDYKPLEIEVKWKKMWDEKKIYSPDLDSVKRPFYNLMMFPYPSAEGLHVGSVFTFTGVDTYGRFKRMQGFDVFEPMGLDGFGIHSENYALKVGRHPKEQAKRSEENFYRQLSSIGNGFDWSRKLETYDPNYYKWTQWIFIQLFKRGLAYRKKAPVNFCPSCKTVLSDEQVIDGKCERCGSVVEKRELEQWFFKITDYAERLLNNIPKLNWTEKVKIAQRDWIGKREGTTIRFVIARTQNEVKGTKKSQKDQIVMGSANPRNDSQYIEVFTTRGDTLYGATFIVLAPEHPVVASLLRNSELEKIRKYVEEVKKKTEIERGAQGKEKTGVFTGLYAINPINNESIPVWIADYALMGYGTGALFGDAHDERDVAFAKKYGIPLKATLITGDKERDERILKLEECFTGDGTLVDSGEFSRLSSQQARERVAEWLEKNKKGGRKVTYHLRDWLISRQRYWGPPIPMIYCQSCAGKGRSWFNSIDSKEENVSSIKYKVSSKDGKFLNTKYVIHTTDDMVGWYPIPEEDLPVILPDVQDWRPEGTGVSPLANHPEFYKTTCPSCGGKARRETDVSDTFLDSAWYFFRYLATEIHDVPFPSEGFINSKSTNQQINKSTNLMIGNWKLEIGNFAKRVKWLPVTMYIGGAEHSVLHLLYSRFITMAFKDLGLIDFEEPFARFYAHGLIIKDRAKMSKSKGNVINPDEYLAKYGADVLRAYLRFVGPFDMGGDFRDSGIEGMQRFLKRVWRLVNDVIASEAKQSSDPKEIASPSFGEARNDNEGKRVMNRIIKGVTDDLEALRFNTAMAKLMTWYNYLSQQKNVSKKELETFLKLLAPIAPFITEELYQNVIASPEGAAISDDGSFRSVHLQPWPSYEPKMLEEGEVTIVVQVNGKVRDSFTVHSLQFTEQSKVEKKAKESSKIKKYIEGKKIKKVIYVEGKIINFVV